MSSTEIKIWNRAKNQEEVEKVYGGEWVERLYGNGLGRLLTDQVLSGHWVSSAYGFFESSAMSRAKIAPFIQNFSIPMHEFEEGPFASFNDFFVRRFKPGMRPFIAAPSQMPAFAEARYLAFEKVGKSDTVPVKGLNLTPSVLLGSEKRAREFEGGPLLLARLCPVDYHRFHFPDGGQIFEHVTLGGPLHSVNPLALKYRPDILVTNERQVTLLETENFGRLAYIEVGALCVGKIVQSHSLTGAFKRGEEKGYFLFGGSTVIVLGQPGKWKPESDLLSRTAQGQEVLVRLGDSVARSLG